MKFTAGGFAFESWGHGRVDGEQEECGFGHVLVRGPGVRGGADGGGEGIRQVDIRGQVGGRPPADLGLGERRWSAPARRRRNARARDAGSEVGHGLTSGGGGEFAVVSILWRKSSRKTGPSASGEEAKADIRRGTPERPRQASGDDAGVMAVLEADVGRDGCRKNCGPRRVQVPPLQGDPPELVESRRLAPAASPAWS